MVSGSPLSIDLDGWLDGVTRVVSPNFDSRPQGTSVSLIVIHNISLPPGIFSGTDIQALFTNTLDHRAHPFYSGLTGLRVSAHFLIRRPGDIIQFVSCFDRAWHAGQSSWRGRERCNDFSIGIELEGSDELPFEEVQYQELARLVLAIRQFYPIEAIVGHSDIAPGRKTDPGPFFDWPRI
ncbi:MAG: 1,6-anhydro-N-acetylmuramyl-L-alanine amidase AmpD, partial [Pseudomonadota bacterium]|nr:1,6-anhydro-N-acetylmuramyl-L-alanine amidase AmpD [Pseudomonadota bacterium]